MRRDVGMFEHRLAATLRAGIPVTQALGIASEGLVAPVRTAVVDAERRVRAGSGLARALGAHPAVFREVEIAIVEVGEETGLLPENLERLAAWNERDQRNVRKLVLGLLYPAILLVLAILLPPLPILVTRSLNAYLLAVARTGGPLVALIFFATVGANVLRHRAPFVWGRIRAGVPFLGPNLRKLEIARFGESLAMLYASGVEIRRALHVAPRAISDPELLRACRRIAQVVERGGSLADGFAAAGVFSSAFLGSVAVGERTGDLDKTLEAFARLSREEADQAINALLIIVPVVIYLLVAAYIAWVVISFFGGYFRTLGSF